MSKTFNNCCTNFLSRICSLKVSTYMSCSTGVLLFISAWCLTCSLSSMYFLLIHFFVAPSPASLELGMRWCREYVLCLLISFYEIKKDGLFVLFNKWVFFCFSNLLSEIKRHYRSNYCFPQLYAYFVSNEILVSCEYT